MVPFIKHVERFPGWSWCNRIYIFPTIYSVFLFVLRTARGRQVACARGKFLNSEIKCSPVVKTHWMYSVTFFHIIRLLFSKHILFPDIWKIHSSYRERKGHGERIKFHARANLTYVSSKTTGKKRWEHTPPGNPELERSSSVCSTDIQILDGQILDIPVFTRAKSVHWLITSGHCNLSYTKAFWYRFVKYYWNIHANISVLFHENSIYICNGERCYLHE